MFMNEPNNNIRKQGQLFNVNENYNYISLTPPHTASRNLTLICNQLDFNTYEVKESGLIFYCSGSTHNHSMMKFNGIEKYKYFMSVRNPYSLVLSTYKGILMNQKSVLSTFNFEKDFRNYCQLNGFVHDYVKYFNDINLFEIKHFIRLENQLEDLAKVPFYLDADLKIKEKIEKISLTKTGAINQRHNYPKIKKLYSGTISSVYDQKSADYIYNDFGLIFEIMNYSKDSWKDLSELVF